MKLAMSKVKKGKYNQTRSQEIADAIQRYVEDPLSEELIRGRLKEGNVEVYTDHGSLAYRAVDGEFDGRQLVCEA